MRIHLVLVFCARNPAQLLPDRTLPAPAAALLATAVGAPARPPLATAGNCGFFRDNRRERHSYPPVASSGRPGQTQQELMSRISGGGYWVGKIMRICLTPERCKPAIGPVSGWGGRGRGRRVLPGRAA